MLLAVMAVVILLRLQPFAALLTDDTLPSDAVLAENFTRHEAEFNELIRMSNADPSVVRIDPDFTWLDGNGAWPRPESELGFSKERWQQYQQLFLKLGLKRGLARYPDGKIIRFIADTRGLLTNGSGKGYIYSTRELSPLYESLDGIEPPPNGAFVYKRLKRPHWYLFYYRKQAGAD